MQRVRHALQRHPLAVVAVCSMIGIKLADGEHANHAWQWFTAALIAIIFLLRNGRAIALAAATLFTFGFIHLVCLSSARDHPLRDLLKPNQHVAATLHGRFVQAPMERDDQPGQQRASFRTTAIDLTARQQRLVGAADIRVWLPPNFTAQGGEYQLDGTLNLIRRPLNPSTFDPVETALHQGIVAEFTPARMALKQAPEFSLRLTLLGTAERCRNWIAAQLARGIEHEEMPRTLITTMALGTSEARIADLQEPFRRSGTLHVFAVSGLHIALLAAIGLILLRPTGLDRMRAVIVLVPLLFGYAYITGWVPSAARAALMSSLLLLAPVFHRQSRVLNTLGAAALVLLASDTLQMFQPGFQLSFIVLGAIAIGAGPLAAPFKRWTELDPFLPMRVASWQQRSGAWLRSHIVSTLATSTAATIGSLPLMLSHFHTCTPVAVISNSVLVPLSSASLFVVTLSLLAGVAGLHLFQTWFNNVNWLIAHAMMSSATMFSSIPGGNFDVPGITFQKQPNARLDVLSLPGGEGAQLLVSGDAHWMLDCGSDTSSRRVITPLLRFENVVKLDGLLLSHADSGHVGGTQTLTNQFHHLAVFASAHEPWRYDAHSTALWQAAMRLEAQQRPLQSVIAGDSLNVGRARIHILYPTLDDQFGRADDRTIVARIDCDGYRILWCNDAGFVTEKLLLERQSADELKCDVLVRNQHADDMTMQMEFLLAARPSAIISSNAPAIAEQRLPAHLREDCKQLGIRLFDQFETGMVAINVFDDRLEVVPWLEGEPLILQRSTK